MNQSTLPPLIQAWSTVPDVLTAAKVLGCGQKKIWQLIRDKQIKTKKLGSQTKVVTASLFDLIDSLPERKSRGFPPGGGRKAKSRLPLEQEGRK